MGVNVGGRMPIVDATAKREAIAAIEIRCAEGIGFSLVGSFAEFMRPYTRDTMRRFNIANWETRPIPFNDTAYRRLYTEICPVKARQGGM